MFARTELACSSRGVNLQPVQGRASSVTRIDAAQAAGEVFGLKKQLGVLKITHQVSVDGSQLVFGIVDPFDKNKFVVECSQVADAAITGRRQTLAGRTISRPQFVVIVPS